MSCFFFFQAEDGIRDYKVTGVQTCALPIYIVVSEKTASRLHARIERRGVQYILIDESTNGTYVQIGADREVLLRRDRVMLRGRGRIAFGTSTAAPVELGLFDCSWAPRPAMARGRGLKF